MKDSHKRNKGMHTEALVPQPEIRTSLESSATMCSSEKKDANYSNEPADSQSSTFPDIEISSSGANEADLYKLKTDLAQPKTFTPGKIEFRRMKKKACKCLYISPRQKTRKNSKHPETRALVESPKQANGDTILSRLRRSFTKMNHSKLFVDDHGNQSIRSPRNPDPEKVDVYYFDHGNAAYFRTTDSPPTILSEMLSQQTTFYATRFWAEIFGSLHIGVTFFITFFLQAYRFILCSVVRATVVGLFQMTSDYLLKPVLTVIFNDAIQPIFILLYNILSSLKDMLDPIAETIGNFLTPVAMVLRSIRLISFTRKTIVCNKDISMERCENLDV